MIEYQLIGNVPNMSRVRLQLVDVLNNNDDFILMKSVHLLPFIIVIIINWSLHTRNQYRFLRKQKSQKKSEGKKPVEAI